ncbi:MAG: DNA polymerase/3'-5' exonuclease PolX [Spirochaetota bacterium]
MPVHNRDVAEIFNHIADLLELKGDNQFRIRSYRNAARTVESMSRNVADMVDAGEDLSSLQGIGKDLAGKIEKIVRREKLDLLEKLKKEVPEELTELLKIGGLGPKKLKKIYDELGIRNMDELKEAINARKIRELEGFGKKTEETIQKEITRLGESGNRFSIATAEEMAAPLMEYLGNGKGVEKIEIAGSFRRRKETVGDIDILAVCKKDNDLMERFTGYEDVDRVVSKGEARSTVILRSGLQVDVRVFEKKSYGAALHYFTGSKEHNVAMRKMAQKQDLKINEYGVFSGKKMIAGKTEEEIYAHFGLAYIEPELRENRGEIDAAASGKLPKLVTLDDIRGDLHTHTDATDGRMSLKEMAEGARNMGYEYMAVTDHSKRVTVAGEMDVKEVRKQMEKIDRLNEEYDDFRLLKGIEVDILEDGSLDLPDELLKELDLCVCAVHYKFNLSREKQTERILRAMENRYFTILAHPTGRMIGERDPYELDMEKIFRAAGENECFIELSAHPKRLDLVDYHCKQAKDMKVKMAISTDSHSTGNLKNMKYGIGQARRGWLEKDDVLNTLSLDDLVKVVKKKR